MKVKKYIWPANRLQRLAVILFVALLLYTVLGFFLVPKIIMNVATSTITKQLNRQTKIEQVKFNPYIFSCQIDGLAIQKKSGPENWIKVDRLLVNLQAASLFKQALILSQLQIDHPQLSITRYSDYTYNFSDLLKEPTAENPDQEAKEPFRFSLNNIEIQSGEMKFIDQPKQTKHQISDLKFSLPTLSNFPFYVDTYVNPHFSAQINNMLFDLGGQTKPFAQTRQSKFDLVINDLSLPYYLNYLPGKRNFSLAKGKLSSNLTVTYGQTSQESTYLNLEGGLEFNNLQLIKTSHKKRDLCTIPNLDIELSGGNLLAGQVHMAKVQIKEPIINLLRLQDGTIFMPTINKEAEPSEEEDNTSSEKTSQKGFSLSLDHFQLDSGTVSFTDNSTSPSFTTRLDPVQFSLRGLQTSSDSPSEFQLGMRTQAGESILINGNFGFNPTSFQAQAELSDLVLNLYAPYYKPYFLGNIDSGQCDLAMNISYKGSKSNEISLDKMKLLLENLSVRDAQGEKAVTIPKFVLQEAKIDPSDQKISVDKISIEEGDFRIKRNKDGSINLGNLIAEKSPKKENRSEDRPSEKTWQFLLDQFSIAQSKTTFLDKTTSSPAELSISNISCSLNNLSNIDGEKGSLDASMLIEKQAKLETKGNFGLSPLQAKIDLGLKNLELKDLEPFIREHADLALQKGVFETKGSLEMSKSVKKDKLSLSFSGQASIVDLKTFEAEKKADFLGWKELKLEGINFDNQRPAIRIKKIDLVGLDSQMLIYPDGSSNLKRILKTKPSKSKPSPKPRQDKDSQAILAVDQFQLSQGKLTFMDNSVSPSFESSLDDLQCTIKDISNQKEQPADISIQAQLGSNAQFNLQGKANFLIEKIFTNIDLHLANLALPPLSPYSGKYVGYAINKGKFNLDSQVRLTGKELQSKNKLLLDQFTLGEKVDSPQAVNAPIKLGIALLKNRKGEIHIDKSVSGDLSDPKFSIVDIVMKVFINVLVKAATSPFAVLGSMFGGGEDINFVLYQPGQASLDQEAKSKMQTLAKALYERPGLKVEVLGRADTSSDKSSLHQKRFRNMLKEQKLQDMKNKGQSKLSLEDIRISQEEYPAYLWQAYKQAPMEKPQNVLGLTKKLPPEELEQRLKTYISITEDDLRNLAKNRAEKVISFLQQAGPVEPERLFLQNPELGASQDHNFRKVEIRIH